MVASPFIAAPPPAMVTPAPASIGKPGALLLSRVALSKSLIVLIACLWALAAAPACLAQANGRSLVQVTAHDIDPTHTDVELDFDQSSPEARVNADGTRRIVVTLMATNRGPAARFDTSQSAMLRDISFDQDGSNLHLTFVSDSRARVDINIDTPNRFLVKLTYLDAPNGMAHAAGVSAIMGNPSGLPRVVDPPTGEDSFELVQLKYADVSEIAGLLSEGAVVKSNDTFTPREPGFGALGSNNGNTPNPQNQSLPDDKSLGQGVDSSIAIDRRLNAIWVRGSPEHIARVKAEIAKIDLPAPSIMLETEFVELDETGARNVGIDFTNSSGQLAVATYQSGQYVPVDFTSHGPGGLSSVSLQAAIYAQIQKGDGRIVSKPKIAAQSGATASIITGDALPILTSITLSGVNGVSQQVQYVNVGVTLQIAPRVSSDGFVSSHVFCVVSSVTGYSQGYPTISQRQAETSATVHDGESFIIGGLVQDSELTSKTKVPVLGDIPVLGRAFDWDNNSRSKTELYIVITPHVVH